MLPADFEDVTGPALDLPSTWRTSVPMAAAAAQTDPIQMTHQRTQEPRVSTLGVQTGMEEDYGDAATMPLVNTQFVESSELTAFLLHSTPMLEEQLLRNVSSTAFDEHDVSWEEERDSVECMHSLKHRGPLWASAPQNPFESCTCVAWNASGTVIAAAYGPLDRNDWALNESMLCTWSIMRRKLDPAKADVALQLQDCLTSLAFHPQEPALLAGGSFNGDVLVWDLGADDDKLLCKTVLNAYTHHEPVQQLTWTKLPGQGYVLCSVSADGKMLVWSPANKLREPLLGFRLPPASKTAGKAMIEGGASVAFSHEDPTTFVAGLEAGQLMKCSLIANELRTAEVVRMQRSDVPWSAAAAGLLTRVPASHYHRLKLRVEKEAVIAKEREVVPRAVFAAQPEPAMLFGSPATFSYEPHSGPVYCTQFSPFHRNVRTARLRWV